MQPINAITLEQYRDAYNIFVQVQIVKHLSFHDRNVIYKIIRDEFDPNYLVDLNCGGCVAKMLVYGFQRKDAQTAEYDKLYTPDSVDKPRHKNRHR